MPWAFILFARNIGETEQIRDLVAEMRDCIGRPDALVFIDQEGGRVQRLRPAGAELSGWRCARCAVAERPRRRPPRRLAGGAAAPSTCFAMASPRLPAGARRADRRRQRRHRCPRLRQEPRAVTELGRASAEGLMSGGVLPVMKHIPGHGRAFADTHFELPTVDASMSELQRHDFAPFRELNDLPMAMTAHVVYSAIDLKNPATTSGKVIDEIIRGEIGFDGLLMSDDTSMKALSGDFPTKAASILAAGCDLVLHCNGVFGEMAGIASRTTGLEGKSLQRAQRR